MLLRNQQIKNANIEFVTAEFMNTLNQLVAMGVTPVIFSPPPANGTHLGRCLAKAQWNGITLDACNFKMSDMSQSRKDVYSFLESVAAKHRVIRLDALICDENMCKTHLDTTWIFRDKGHLSHEGSAKLGIKHNFYQLLSEKAR